MRNISSLTDPWPPSHRRNPYFIDIICISDVLHAAHFHVAYVAMP